MSYGYPVPPYGYPQRGPFPRGQPPQPAFRHEADPYNDHAMYPPLHPHQHPPFHPQAGPYRNGPPARSMPRQYGMPASATGPQQRMPPARANGIGAMRYGGGKRPAESGPGSASAKKQKVAPSPPKHVLLANFRTLLKEKMDAISAAAEKHGDAEPALTAAELSWELCKVRTAFKARYSADLHPSAFNCKQMSDLVLQHCKEEADLLHTVSKGLVLVPKGLLAKHQDAFAAATAPQAVKTTEPKAADAAAGAAGAAGTPAKAATSAATAAGTPAKAGTAPAKEAAAKQAGGAPATDAHPLHSASMQVKRHLRSYLIGARLKLFWQLEEGKTAQQQQQQQAEAGKAAQQEQQVAAKPEPEAVGDVKLEDAAQEGSGAGPQQGAEEEEAAEAAAPADATGTEQAEQGEQASEAAAAADADAATEQQAGEEQQAGAEAVAAAEAAAQPMDGVEAAAAGSGAEEQQQEGQGAAAQPEQEAQEAAAGASQQDQQQTEQQAEEAPAAAGGAAAGTPAGPEAAPVAAGEGGEDSTKADKAAPAVPAVPVLVEYGAEEAPEFMAAAWEVALDLAAMLGKLKSDFPSHKALQAATLELLVSFLREPHMQEAMPLAHMLRQRDGSWWLLPGHGGEEVLATCATLSELYEILHHLTLPFIGKTGPASVSAFRLDQVKQQYELRTGAKLDPKKDNYGAGGLSTLVEAICGPRVKVVTGPHPSQKFITPAFDFRQELRQHLQAAMEAVFQRQHSLADFAASPQLGLPLPAFLDSFKKAHHYSVPATSPPGTGTRQQLLASMPELALLVGPAAGASEPSLVPSPVMHIKALLREKVEGLPDAPEPRSEAATAGYPSTSVLQEFSEAYGYAFPSAARQHGLPPLLDLLPRLASACTTVAGPQGGVFLFPPAQGAKDLALTAKSANQPPPPAKPAAKPANQAPTPTSATKPATTKPAATKPATATPAKPAPATAKPTPAAAPAAAGRQGPRLPLAGPAATTARPAQGQGPGPARQPPTQGPRAQPYNIPRGPGTQPGPPPGRPGYQQQQQSRGPQHAPLTYGSQQAGYNPPSAYGQQQRQQQQPRQQPPPRQQQYQAPQRQGPAPAHSYQHSYQGQAQHSNPSSITPVVDSMLGYSAPAAPAAPALDPTVAAAAQQLSGLAAAILASRQNPPQAAAPSATDTAQAAARAAAALIEQLQRQVQGQQQQQQQPQQYQQEYQQAYQPAYQPAAPLPMAAPQQPGGASAPSFININGTLMECVAVTNASGVPEMRVRPAGQSDGAVQQQQQQQAAPSGGLYTFIDGRLQQVQQDAAAAPAAAPAALQYQQQAQQGAAGGQTQMMGMRHDPVVSPPQQRAPSNATPGPKPGSAAAAGDAQLPPSSYQLYQAANVANSAQGASAQQQSTTPRTAAAKTNSSFNTGAPSSDTRYSASLPTSSFPSSAAQAAYQPYQQNTAPAAALPSQAMLSGPSLYPSTGNVQQPAAGVQQASYGMSGYGSAAAGQAAAAAAGSAQQAWGTAQAAGAGQQAWQGAGGAAAAAQPAASQPMAGSIYGQYYGTGTQYY